jgi:hypothetical protein
MTDATQAYPHLNDAARALIDATDAVRIKSIQSGTWLGYGRAKEILARLEELLDYPRITRMPNMLLVAPSFNGKTSILERFLELHPVDLDATAEVTTCPVVMVESPPTPDVSAFYIRILDALMAPYKPTGSPQERNSQVKLLFKQLGVKMLIIDEIHHLIAGSMNKQRDFRNALKSLGNETKVVIVAAGIEDAYNAFNTDPQMSSRFTPEVLPLWKADVPWRNAHHLRKPLTSNRPRKCRPSMTAARGRWAICVISSRRWRLMPSGRGQRKSL